MPTFSLDEAVEDSPAAVTPPQTFGLDEALTPPEPKSFGLDEAVDEPVPKLTILPSSPLNLDVPPQGKIPEPTELPSLAGGVPALPPEPTKFQQVKTGLSDFSQETAKVASSIADDIVAGKGEFSGNIPAMISGEPLPYEKTVQDITKSNPKTAIVAQAAQNIIGIAPQLLIPGGALPKLAQRVLAGVFTYFIFKNAKETAVALGDEYGKAPEDRDPNKVRDLWANAIEDTGFAALTGYGTAQPGITKEIPSLQKFLTKSVVESYPPEQLRGVFDRVTTGQDTPEERNLYDLISQNIPNRVQAIKKGVIVTTEGVPRLDYDALSKYLGIKEPSVRTATIAGEQPPTIPLTPEAVAAGERSISQPVQQLTTGEDYASGITSPESLSQLEVRPQVGESPPLRQQGEVAGTRPAAEVAPPPSQEAVVPPVEVTPPMAGWQVTVQPPQVPGDVGYVQIDDVSGGQNKWSSSPEKLRAQGYNLPDFSKLPQGRYTLADALKQLDATVKIPPAKPAPVAESVAIPVNGGRVSLSGGDKFHSDVAGTVYQVHNEGAVLDVIKDGTDYPVRVTVSDYKNKQFQPFKTETKPTAQPSAKPKIGMSVEESKAYLNRPGQVMGYDEKSLLDAQQKKGALAAAKPPVPEQSLAAAPAQEGVEKEAIFQANQSRNEVLDAADKFMEIDNDEEIPASKKSTEKFLVSAKAIENDLQKIYSPPGVQIESRRTSGGSIYITAKFPNGEVHQISIRDHSNRAFVSEEDSHTIYVKDSTPETERGLQNMDASIEEAQDWIVEKNNELKSKQPTPPPSPSSKPAQAQEGVKEPWQIKQSDFIDSNINKKDLRDKRKVQLVQSQTSALRIRHRQEVESALSEGKSVPPEVLADYPDLKPTPTATAETTPTKAETPTVAQPETDLLPSETRTVGQQWDSTKLGTRIRWLRASGYVTRMGKLTNQSSKWAEAKWDTLSDAAKKVIGKWIVFDFPKVGERATLPAKAQITEGMSLNPVEHGFDSVEQFQSDFEKLSIKEDADTLAETKDEYLKRKHCQSLAQTPIKRAMRKKP